MPEDFADSINKEPWFQELIRTRPSQAAILCTILTTIHSLILQMRDSAISMEQASIAGVPDGLKRLMTLNELLVEPEVLKDKISMNAEIEESMRFLLDHGMTVPRAMEHVNAIKAVWSKRRRGRPSERKRLAVLAYDTKLTNPDLTWDEVTDKICPCTKGFHDESCREAIRIEVIQLKKVLSEFNVNVVIAHAKR